MSRVYSRSSLGLFSLVETRFHNDGIYADRTQGLPESSVHALLRDVPQAAEILYRQMRHESDRTKQIPNQRPCENVGFRENIATLNSLPGGPELAFKYIIHHLALSVWREAFITSHEDIIALASALDKLALSIVIRGLTLDWRLRLRTTAATLRQGAEGFSSAASDTRTNTMRWSGGTIYSRLVNVVYAESGHANPVVPSQKEMQHSVEPLYFGRYYLPLTRRYCEAIASKMAAEIVVRKIAPTGFPQELLDLVSGCCYDEAFLGCAAKLAELSPKEEELLANRKL